MDRPLDLCYRNEGSFFANSETMKLSGVLLLPEKESRAIFSLTTIVNEISNVVYYKKETENKNRRER